MRYDFRDKHKEGGAAPLVIGMGVACVHCSMIPGEFHSQTARILGVLEIDDELYWQPIRQVNPGPWTGHLAIAFWLVKAAQPTMFVELGTHSGNSYSAFCQAIAHFGMPARAFAIDTWLGDEQAGFYDESVFREFSAFNQNHFGGFSKLLRSTFDEARKYFSDGSIDLLHIDGLHTYEAVKHDFDTWSSALSSRAVVVFHDTSMRGRDFGVWKLWHQLTEIYPSFEFHHSEGLGILGVGQDQPRLLRSLFELDPQSSAIVRRLFATRGAAFLNRSEVLALEQEVASRDASLRDQVQEIRNKDDEIRTRGQEVVKRDALLMDREQQLSSLQQELAVREATLRSHEEEIEHSKTVIRQRELTIASKDKILSARQKKIAELEKCIATQQERLAAAAKSLDEERSTGAQRIDSLQQELSRLRKTLALIEGSTAWKLASRLRSAFEPYPKARLYSRRVGRLLWWTVSFQLVGRLRARHRLFEARDMIAKSGLFDANWYLSQYPDLAEAGCDPALHYALFGASERRNPGPSFDAEAYLQRYPEVAEAGINPLVHFLQCGASEGCIITPVDAPTVDTLPEVVDEQPEVVELLAETPSRDYQSWIATYDTLTDEDRTAIGGDITLLQDRPLISVLMPVYNTNPAFLRKAIDSVLAQLYPNWELCIADDASSNPKISTTLDEYAQRDRRIQLVYRQENGHISAASNSALALARGSFIALMDHDDELSEHALYMVAVELNEHPDADIIYSDEDRIDENGLRSDPHFKPEWNLNLFYSYNVINHLGVYRTSVVRELGGFRDGFEGSQDYDLALRVLDKSGSGRIRHIPHILYHWRTTPSTFSTTFLQTAVEAGRRALAEHFERRGESVKLVEGSKPYITRLMRPVPEPPPLVSLIIPTRDKVELLRDCVDGLLNRTTYQNLEIIIVDNESQQHDTLEYFDSLASNSRVRILRIDSPFNYSALNNSAVSVATGDIIGFINNDIDVIQASWLAELVSQVVVPGVGAVGAKLLYPDGTVQHAGVIIGLGGVAGHSHKDFPGSDFGYFCRLQLAYNVSGVTAACMLMPKRVFEEVGGFDEVNLTVAFNDVDLCLRIREAGYSIVWTPYAELYHRESASRGSDEAPERVERAVQEQDYMKERWGDVLLNDPFYSPNLTLEHENYGLSFPPRTTKPWRETASIMSPIVMNERS